MNRIFIATACALVVTCSFAEDPEYVEIRAVEGLQFSPARLTAKSGEQLRIAFENGDPNDQPHNLVIIKPGSLEEIQAASMVLTPDSMAKGFIPENDNIIAATGLLDADATEHLLFTVPREKGVYHYVCTFPGHAMLMYGALYVGDRPETSLKDDPNVPELVRNAEKEKEAALLAVERPTMMRAFMPDAGPAAIGVALPGDLNYCWDAGNGRLRYIWEGDFVSAIGLWNSNGNALAKPLGDKIWESKKGELVRGIQFGEDRDSGYQFHGYDMKNGLPTFRYSLGKQNITESITPQSEGIEWKFTIEAPESDVRVLAPESDNTVISSSTGERDGDWWVIPQPDANEFTLTISKS